MHVQPKANVPFKHAKDVPIARVREVVDPRRLLTDEALGQFEAKGKEAKRDR